MATPGRPRLYLIDGYALIFRAFHALGGGAPLRNARGENTGMAKGVSDFIKRLIEKHKPEYLGWVNDAGSSGREELLESYKANRVALPDEEQEDFDTGVERQAQRRQRGFDARRARDPAVLDWNVQVLADQHPLALEVEIRHADDFRRRHGWGHFAAANASVVSSMRFEKPHSLSYHAQALTSLPSMTFVRLES